MRPPNPGSLLAHWGTVGSGPRRRSGRVVADDLTAEGDWERAQPRNLTGVMTGVTVTAMMITPGMAGVGRGAAASGAVAAPAPCDQP